MYGGYVTFTLYPGIGFCACAEQGNGLEEKCIGPLFPDLASMIEGYFDKVPDTSIQLKLWWVFVLSLL